MRSLAAFLLLAQAVAFTPPAFLTRSTPATRAAVSVRMEEGAAPEEVAAPEVAEVAAPAIDAGSVDDFTEDLLDALAADESPWETEQKPVLVGMDNPEESLEALPSYGNSLTVDEMRAKYKMHDGDTGSAQVQVAVLTARITYMTKHMQENKKDYASLRGLTRMVTRRRKLLEYLLREDLDEFKRITSDLGIRTRQLLKPKLSGARGRRV
jgi:small subunit ribosomal protein S15